MEKGEGRKAIAKFLARKKTVVYEDLIKTLKDAGYKDPIKILSNLKQDTDLFKGKTITKPIGPSKMRPDQIIGFGDFKGKNKVPGSIKFKLPKHRRRFIEILTDFTNNDTSKWLTLEKIADEFNTSETGVSDAMRILREKIPKLQQGTEKNRTNRFYADLVKEYGHGNKKFSDLTNEQKSPLRSQAHLRKKFPEGEKVWTDTKIKGRIYPLSSALDPDITKRIINFFNKWKEDPTKENLAKLHSKLKKLRTTEGGSSKEQSQISSFIKYLKGEKVSRNVGTETIEQWDKIKDTLLSPKEQTTLKDLPKSFFLQQAVLKSNVDRFFDPVRYGTNDQTAIVEYFRDNPDTSTKQALADLSNDPEVVLRAKNKHNGIINDRYLRDRIATTYKTVIRKQVDQIPTRHPALQTFNIAALNAFARNAYKNFANDIHRGIEGTILETYGPRDPRRQLALDKLKAFKQMTKAFQAIPEFKKYKFGKPRAPGTSLIQFDHPISFASLRKGGSLALEGSLNVNPVQGDLNQIKGKLDKHLGTLRNRSIKGIDVNTELKALQDINKTLFGERVTGTYEMTPKGRLKSIDFGAPHLLEADLLQEFEKNLGLGKAAKANLKNVDAKLWEAAGIRNSAQIGEGIQNLKKWDVGSVKGFLKGWISKNPEQAEILSRSVGCYSAGGRVGLKIGGDPSFKCLTDKIDNKPNIVVRALKRIPTGGKLGLLAGAVGAAVVGIGTMFGGPGAKAEETPTTDQMTYNATEGKFVDNKGDPETQEGVLNWIGEHPIYSGLAAIPVGMGAGLGAGAMGFKEAANFFGSAKFILPPAYAAEKIYQYKKGEDLGEMFTNPIDAVWAMALDTKATGMSPGGAKAAYYAKAGEPLGLKNLNPKRWRETGSALKRAALAPASRGTRLVFPFATEKYGFGKPITEGWRALAPSGIKRGLGMAARMLPLGPIPMALIAGSMAWDKYKFNKEIGNIVDSMRARGVVNEEDAQTMQTIYKQGWLGTTAIGAKLLGSEELMFEGEMLDIEAQRDLLNRWKAHYEDREETATKERVGERQEDFFSWFSKGGRVGLKEGGPPFGMTRRTFLKWLVGSIAAGVAAVSGKGLKQAAKTATATVAKTPQKFIGVEGMPLWFPRAVAKIKTHGKLIEMADKDYVQGDMYEMMIPVKIKRALSGRKGHDEIVTEQRKVIMEENPLNGEISMQWTGTDNFGDDAVRQINFKPGKSGYQKFGVDPEYPQAWEYQRVKVEEPEFTYTQPDQSNPYRDDIEFLDIFEEGDEIVKGLEDMTGSKQMVTKEGTVIDVSAEGKNVDEAFKKKIYKDIEGEDALVEGPQGEYVGPEGDWVGEKGSEIIEGEIPKWVPTQKWPKKAEGGRVGMKFGGSWADWMSNHSDDMTFEEYLKMDIDKPVHPIDKKAGGGVIETGNIARRPGAVPPLSGPTPQGSGIVGLFSNPKRVNIA